MHPQHLTEELLKILFASRQIANEFNHEYIHIDHLFLAMLRTPCLATPFLQTINEEKWVHNVKDNYAGNTDLPSPENIPMTLEVERVIVHADAFAFMREEDLTNSVDVLLAMLAYNNPVKEDLNKKGWLLEGIMEQQYGPDVVWPPLPVEKQSEVPMAEWAIMADEYKQEDIERLYQEALMLTNYGLHEEVEVICNAALAFNPAHLDFMSLLAFAAYSQKKYDLVDPLLKGLEQHSTYVNWCVEIRTGIASRLGNYEWAIQALEQQLLIDPYNVLLLNNIGYYLSKIQQFSAAITHLKKAAHLDPDRADVQNNLGFSLYRTGQQKAGIDAILYSLELNKGNAYAYKNLGVIYKETGDPVKAKEHFQLALKYKYTALYGDDVLTLLKQLN